MARSRLIRLLAACRRGRRHRGRPCRDHRRAAQAPECRWAGRGYDANVWLGGPGSWSDATKWSKQRVPGLATRDYACIPQGSDIVIDDQ